MAKVSAQASSQVSWSDWKVILLASLGGALEFYDFVVYSQFAQYIGANFFPSDDAMVSLIISFSVFAIGYFARPLGGIFFSHMGDRIGRRRVLIVTILAMSGATLGIGLLPTYAQIGVLAPALLVLFRVIQGFCLGGELPGAITYVVETAPRRSGFSVGLIFFCVNSGVLLAALLNLVVHENMSVEAIGSWGWRIGFLVGGALGIVSFFLRMSLEESREFARMRATAGESRVPFKELFSTHAMAVFVGFLVLAVTAGFNGLLFAMPTYLSQTMGYMTVDAARATNVGLAVISIGLLAVAWLSDRFSRKALMLIGTTALMLLALPFFQAAQNMTLPLIPMFALAGMVASLCTGTVIGVCADLFPTRIRFSGVAMSFNLSFTLLSGLAPVLAAYFARETGDPTSAAYFMIACAALSFIGALLMHRYDGQIVKDLLRQEA